MQGLTMCFVCSWGIRCSTSIDSLRSEALHRRWSWFLKATLGSGQTQAPPQTTPLQCRGICARVIFMLKVTWFARWPEKTSWLQQWTSGIANVRVGGSAVSPAGCLGVPTKFATSGVSNLTGKSWPMIHVWLHSTILVHSVAALFKKHFNYFAHRGRCRIKIKVTPPLVCIIRGWRGMYGFCLTRFCSFTKISETINDAPSCWLVCLDALVSPWTRCPSSPGRLGWRCETWKMALSRVDKEVQRKTCVVKRRPLRVVWYLVRDALATKKKCWCVL